MKPIRRRRRFFICHTIYIHNYTEYNQQWNVFSAFNPSKCTHTWSSGHTHTQTHTHTHTHTHTPGAVGSQRCGARGAVGGSVPCSRVSPQSWTIPAGTEIRTHNLGLISWAKIIPIKRTKDLTTSVCMHWIYLIHEFHNLSWITEINELFHNILI